MAGRTASRSPVRRRNPAVIAHRLAWSQAHGFLVQCVLQDGGRLFTGEVVMRRIVGPPMLKELDRSNLAVTFADGTRMLVDDIAEVRLPVSAKDVP